MMFPHRFAELKESAVKTIIAQELRRNGGNRTRTARALGLERTYLLRLIKRYGLKGA